MDFFYLAPRESKKCPTSPRKPGASSPANQKALSWRCLSLSPQSLEISSWLCTPPPLCMEPTPLGVSLSSQSLESKAPGSQGPEALGCWNPLQVPSQAVGSCSPRMGSGSSAFSLTDSSLTWDGLWLDTPTPLRLPVQAAVPTPLPCIHTPMRPGLLFKETFIPEHVPLLSRS